MYKIDVPEKGKVLLNKKLHLLHEELKCSADVGLLKSNYRNSIKQLIHRIKNNYDHDFWSEIRWIWNHLNEMNLVGDMWISDTEYQEPLPIYQGFSDIAKQFKKYVDDHSPINELNFPVDIYINLYDEILKAKGKRITTTLYGPEEIIFFDHNKAISTLNKIHRISLTTYKERINLTALSDALSLKPKTNPSDNNSEKPKNKPLVNQEKVQRRMSELSNQGYTDTDAAEIVHEEIGRRRSTSTIKKWFRNYT